MSNPSTLAVARRRAVSTVRRLGLPLAGLAVLLSACAGSGGTDTTPDDAGRTVHAGGEGALSISLGRGGVGLDPPRRSPWKATFGGGVLCSADGSPVTLEAVHYDVSAEPLDLATGLRVVPASEGTTRGRDLVGSSVGSPEDVVDGHRTAGTYRAGVAGTEITTRCPGSPDGRFVELLTSMRVGHEGARVDRWRIDYRSGGRAYTLDVDWQLIACGTEVTSTRAC